MLDKFMQLKKLARRTLDAQQLYFRTKDSATLLNAKQLEDDLRALLDECDQLLATPRPNPGPADPEPEPSILEPYEDTDPDLAQAIRADLVAELERISTTGPGFGEVALVFVRGRIREIKGTAWRRPRKNGDSRDEGAGGQ